MKKAVAVILAALLLLGGGALAKPSVGNLTQSLRTLEAQTPLSEGLYVDVRQADTSAYENPAVRQAVGVVNDPAVAATVRDTVRQLADYLPEGTRLDANDIVVLRRDDGTETAFDLTVYDFVTPFVDLVVTDGVEAAFGDGDNVVSAKTTLAIEALAGETALEDYLILLIEPHTGRLWFIDLDPTAYDAETGEVTVVFPSLGAFSLIQK